MTNYPFSQSVPTSAQDIPNNQIYSKTPMQTVVGTAQVAQCSYDVQGEAVGSEQDTPIDVNALHGVTIESESQLQSPSTGTGWETA